MWYSSKQGSLEAATVVLKVVVCKRAAQMNKGLQYLGIFCQGRILLIYWPRFYQVEMQDEAWLGKCCGILRIMPRRQGLEGRCKFVELYEPGLKQGLEEGLNRFSGVQAVFLSSLLAWVRLLFRRGRDLFCLCMLGLPIIYVNPLPELWWRS